MVRWWEVEQPGPDRPLRDYLGDIETLCPGIWREVDRIRTFNGKTVQGELLTWPGWCFLPAEAWSVLVKTYAKESPSDENLAHGNLVVGAAALGAWRPNQGIYTYHPDVYKAVTSTRIKGDIPTEILFRLPQWCVFIETPADLMFRGFFAFLDHERDRPNEPRMVLAMLAKPSGLILHIVIPLGPWTLAQASEKNLSRLPPETMEHLFKEFGADEIKNFQTCADFISPYLALVLYLCSEQPDILSAEYGDAGKKPGNVWNGALAKGWRIVPPKRPQHWDVGRTISEIISREGDASTLQAGTGRTVRTHVRNAHWHGYWVGKADEKKYILKWLHPTIVNAAKDA